jgi:hypothetical protein
VASELNGDGNLIRGGGDRDRDSADEPLRSQVNPGATISTATPDWSGVTSSSISSQLRSIAIESHRSDRSTAWIPKGSLTIVRQARWVSIG